MSINYDDIGALIKGILEDVTPPPLPPQPEKVIAPTVQEPPLHPAVLDHVVNEAVFATPELQEPVTAPTMFPDTTPTVFTDTEERTEAPAMVLPTFTSAEIAQTLDLRNFATLVTLNTARWHAKVKDRKASKDAALAVAADERAFETRKHLLVGVDDKLKRIHKSLDTARAKHYEMTLPWTTTGVEDFGRRTGARMLPNSLFFDYIKEMGECKAEMTAALDDFVPDYPNLVEAAKQKLGRSFDISEYPNAESIRNHFDLSFDFQPIPQGQDFKGLPQAQCDALARAVTDKTTKMVENAMHDVWIRLHDVVSHMYDRLSHPDKMFHHTLVSNVEATAKVLKHLNVTHDARVENLRQYVEQNLVGHDVEDLRKKPTLRTQVAAHALHVLQEMDKIGRQA